MTNEKTNYPTSRASNPPENYPYAQYRDDEISLVDLALILIRRRWWVIGTGVAVVALAFVFALLNRSEPAYRFVTLYEVAQHMTVEGESQPLQSVNTLIRRVENIHWPAYVRRYLDDNPDINNMPFELALENPNATLLISMRSVGPLEKRDEIEAMHRMMLDEVQTIQNSALNTRRNQLETQISRIESNLERTGNGMLELPPELVASYSDRLMELTAVHETLAEGEVIQYAARGERVSTGGPGGSLILALGIVLGGFLGLMAGFFAEFAGRVRESLNEAN